MTMQIYPAIDLQANRCVRLYQGQFMHNTVYSDNPFMTAKEFIAQGANWLHIVDLDAAKNSSTHHYLLIEEMIRHLSINIQIGGGIRTAKQIETLLSYGANRIIVGSQAIYQPEEVKSWLQQYGAEKIMLALDVKMLADTQYYVCVNGWQNTTDIKLETLLGCYLDNGLIHVLFTDITQDGTLHGPNINLYKTLRKFFSQIKLQASGGISCLDDLKQLKAIDCAGAIIGRALYENKFTLREALSC
jgi:phosphoribosylformimino-5-aminoimidazole carboxamide ribotide isomerase